MENVLPSFDAALQLHSIQQKQFFLLLVLPLGRFWSGCQRWNSLIRKQMVVLATEGPIVNAKYSLIFIRRADSFLGSHPPIIPLSSVSDPDSGGLLRNPDPYTGD